MGFFSDLFQAWFRRKQAHTPAPRQPEGERPPEPPAQPIVRRPAPAVVSPETQQLLSLDREKLGKSEMQSLLSTLKLQTRPIPAKPAAATPVPPPEASKNQPAPVPAPVTKPLRIRTRQTGGDSAFPTLRDETRTSIANLSQAPAMAWLAGDLLRVLSQKDVDLRDVVEVASKDPAITTRILRMANSAAIAPEQRIRDLTTAVTILGIQRVHVAAQALITMRETRNLVDGFNWNHLWTHCFASALLSAELPLRLGIDTPQEAYVAGLLHDLGKILLSYLNPPKYRQLMMDSVCEGAPLFDGENKIFGLCHEEAGAEFARLSKLSPGVIAAIEFHSDPGLAGDHRLLVAIISAANYLAKFHGLGFSGSPVSLMEESLGETEAWQILMEHCPNPVDPATLHLELRPFLQSLKQELHNWQSGN